MPATEYTVKKYTAGNNGWHTLSLRNKKGNYVGVVTFMKDAPENAHTAYKVTINTL